MKFSRDVRKQFSPVGFSHGIQVEILAAHAQQCAYVLTESDFALHFQEMFVAANRSLSDASTCSTSF